MVGTGSHSLSPTRSVSFLDTTNCNYLVGSALLGSSTITPSFPMYLLRGWHPHGLAVGDFNNDGIPDVAVPNCGSSNAGILLGTSTGILGAPLTPANATGNCPLSSLRWETAWNTNLQATSRAMQTRFEGARPNMGGPALRHSSQTARAVFRSYLQFPGSLPVGHSAGSGDSRPPFDRFDAGSRSNHHGAWRMRCRRCK